MSTQITKESFEQFYDDTYIKVLKYTMCHCKNLDDVNDMIQEIYVELYERLCKNHNNITIENINTYIIKIANYKLKKYHSFKISKSDKSFNMEELDTFQNMVSDITEDLITKDNAKKVWNYLKQKNDVKARIFYLHYVLDDTIKEISKELGITESNVKNHLYRTQKELKEFLMKGDDNI